MAVSVRLEHVRRVLLLAVGIGLLVRVGLLPVRVLLLPVGISLLAVRILLAVGVLLLAVRIALAVRILLLPLARVGLLLLAAVELALLGLGDELLDGAGRDGEADADVAAALAAAGGDLGVDADDLAVLVEQRAAGVAGVERGVGLDRPAQL